MLMVRRWIVDSIHRRKSAGSSVEDGMGGPANRTARNWLYENNGSVLSSLTVLWKPF
ncbi:hypothetical protein DPMN_155874 [Dreissena polymorpha]|uniref:Uncharacterized protein n=1 Tax=Dreissena polymorpha TaxID=45954 RepID=A0A9D4FQ70_DREPO|nr:hypothetical protein DPMN_155874 [Dreissena polymorpha]